MNLKVLGSGQDAGVPHIGCRCPTCNRARKYASSRRLGPSIAVFDRQVAFCYLVDASPDFASQVDMIGKEIGRVARPGKLPISGIFLTHAHFGHYLGLWHLGKEGLDEKGMPVFCTARMKRFLSTSRPFNQLVQNRNIRIRQVRPGERVMVSGIKVRPIPVPHRSEMTDGVGYIIEASRRVIYIPDTDRWTTGLIEEIASCDIALLDGTFYSSHELPRFKEVPHPPISESIKLLDGLDTEIYFTHINHTNPVHRRGRQSKGLEKKGFKIAYDGLVLRAI
jgi:pyrroloquinoline quinone biosynthesis protein B